MQAGDTLSSIAARYGISTDELALRNQLSRADMIWVGQHLNLSGSSAAPVAIAAPEAVPVTIPIGEIPTQRLGTSMGLPSVNRC